MCIPLPAIYQVPSKDEVLSQGQLEAYGIYVVKPSDNVWNIHFMFLREYFKNRGIRVTAMADEPYNNGSSSGVGRILKFSENMVYIYNLHDGRLEADLDFIHPLSKIVIFNMGEVLSILSEVDYGNIDQIRFEEVTIDA